MRLSNACIVIEEEVLLSVLQDRPYPLAAQVPARDDSLRSAFVKLVDTQFDLVDSSEDGDSDDGEEDSTYLGWFKADLRSLLRAHFLLKYLPLENRYEIREDGVPRFV